MYPPASLGKAGRGIALCQFSTGSRIFLNACVIVRGLRPPYNEDESALIDPIRRKKTWKSTWAGKSAN